MFYQVFRIPQIGYSATTTDLSDKEQFGYYLRVVPSDVWQARAINQLLRHFNWTYIAVVYSSGIYFYNKNFDFLTNHFQVIMVKKGLKHQNV